MNARWYFDFISPFAYLQWPRIRALATRVDFEFKPIVFAGLLDHHGHKGPAEIPGKREFTYQFVQWRAEKLGVPLRFPPAHPFNPIAALRLCIAAHNSPAVITAIFDHLWRKGLRGDDAQSLDEVAAILGINDVAAAIAAPEVKNKLRENFSAALADKIFGVPSIAMNGRLFWGEDATNFFEDYLANPALFDGEEKRRLSTLPAAVARK